MRTECLPLATPYDPAEDPPGSVDPLGTVTTAEQLADVLFSGMTARMWRARHLTLAALAAHVAEQATSAGAGDEELRLEARLAFERLFVSAIARQERLDDTWRRASRRLPGISLARRALASGDQPLGRQTFLKGQAINGPFGVVASLVRDLDVIDDDNRLSRSGQDLLLAWAGDQVDMAGLLDADGSSSEGVDWLRQLVGRVVAYVRESRWPASGWRGWEDLAQRLRPDVLGRQERQVIYRLLTEDRSKPRRRCLELLVQKETVGAYRSLLAEGGRGVIDRQILVSQIQQCLKPAEDAVDRTIDYAIGLIDGCEQVGGYLESVLRGILWGLTHRGGRATSAELLADPTLSRHLAAARRKLIPVTRQLAAQLADLAQHPKIHDAVDAPRLLQLLDDAQAGLIGERELVDRVMARHGRVQEQKRKGVWIERDPRYWTLLPGFGDNREQPWRFDGAYLHPFRVTNAYSFLTDLRRIPRVEVHDAEEED